MNVFLDQYRQVLKKHEARHKIILVLDYIVYNKIDSPNLIILERYINAVCVVKSFAIFLFELILVDNRVLFTEVLGIVRA